MSTESKTSCSLCGHFMMFSLWTTMNQNMAQFNPMSISSRAAGTDPGPATVTSSWVSRDSVRGRVCGSQQTISWGKFPTDKSSEARHREQTSELKTHQRSNEERSVFKLQEPSGSKRQRWIKKTHTHTHAHTHTHTHTHRLLVWKMFNSLSFSFANCSEGFKRVE